jgi:hypothetical protein
MGEEEGGKAMCGMHCIVLGPRRGLDGGVPVLGSGWVAAVFSQLGDDLLVDGPGLAVGVPKKHWTWASRLLPEPPLANRQCSNQKKIFVISFSLFTGFRHLGHFLNPFLNVSFMHVWWKTWPQGTVQSPLFITSRQSGHCGPSSCSVDAPAGRVCGAAAPGAGARASATG